MLNWYLCRSSFAHLAPETKRNYTDDYCLFFDFLWSRGKWWSEASADDLWAFDAASPAPARMPMPPWNRLGVDDFLPFAGPIRVRTLPPAGSIRRARRRP
ncbi:hypothetical protein DSC45_22340 [Streptomyces sp. YIM 130001]|uniref:hypothetical protein n=1 Tax=Streptomyces sp. YIM 130001 TaxID=2259644 RepID=UPI000E654310|nr:hypothetical protein [Streptomyces sp. YIM 130001]RII13695.1 hypothetical protein DSC45_22340 [Streptomyces sp. YIM 130001]